MQRSKAPQWFPLKHTAGTDRAGKGSVGKFITFSKIKQLAGSENKSLPGLRVKKN
uniref:Uncharacterized protein n=1 Tax=Anguilla anguilla TaxID=7936 RepID=A0A0E9UJ05_ANGAN